MSPREQGFVLYSTDPCPLCEEAQAVIQRATGATVAEVDIKADIALLRRYRHHIPVLADRSQQRELCWPFDEAAVSAFMANKE